MSPVSGSVFSAMNFGALQFVFSILVVAVLLFFHSNSFLLDCFRFVAISTVSSTT